MFISKKIIFFLFTGLVSINSNLAQDLKKTEKDDIQTLIKAFKNQNISLLANQVSYPFMRQYPIKPIRNKKEFITRYHQIVDQNLINKIIHSNVNNDWSRVGRRGTMLNQGDIWLNENGQLIAVNSISNYEKKLIQKLVAIDKKRLHNSLSEYEKPIFKGYTKNVRFRIDLLKDQTYRYASWDINKAMNEKPDLVILNGQLNIEGSIGNQIFEFKSLDYQYTISDEQVKGKNSKMITIFKNDSVIQKEIIFFDT
jgi:hypothetical protein